MPSYACPFPLMQPDVVGSDDAVEMALRANEEGDERWIPIAAELSADLLNEGEVARIGLGVSAIPQTHACAGDPICYCVLPPAATALRGYGLLRIMPLTRFEQWCDQWEVGLPQEN